MRVKQGKTKSKAAPFVKPNPKGCATQFKSLYHPPGLSGLATHLR